MFCPNDKALMRPSKHGLACPKCGHRAEHQPDESLVLKTKPSERRTDKFADLGLIDDPTKLDPMVHPIDEQVRCGACGNWGAYYFMMQTRRADEPTTRFYKCTKCGRRWKSGK